MKYMLLIHQGTTPVPGTDAWEKLSEDEQKKVYADYAAINKTPGVTPADVQRVEPARAEAEPEPEPEPEAPQAPDPLEAVLVGALDSLGQAHHRPFSRG